MVKNKARQYTIDLYADGIIKEMYAYKDVPRRFKKDVKAALVALGHGDLAD